MPTEQVISGSCLCGAISYSLSVSPLFQAHCHCQDCRKNTGSAYAVLVFVPIDSLSWQGQTQTFTHRAESGSIMTKHFCASCGSQLFGTNSTKPDRIHIKVGSVKDAQWFEPQCNVWASSRLPSTPINSGVKDFAQMPTSSAKK